MQSATRFIFYVIGAISFFVGFENFLSQYVNGEEITWGFPIILIGFGAGMPLVLWLNPDWFQSSEVNFDSPSSDDGGLGSSGEGDD